MYDRSPLPALNLSAIGAGGDADGLGPIVGVQGVIAMAACRRR